MKKFIAVCLALLLFFTSSNYTFGEDYEEKYATVNGTYSLKVKIDKWKSSPSIENETFPDASLVHEIKIQIKYDGQKPGYTTPLFTVSVDGEVTDKVEVKLSSSGGSGLFVNLRKLNIPSLGGEDRGVEGSVRFIYKSETTEFIIDEEPRDVRVWAAGFVAGQGSITMDKAPPSETDTHSNEGNEPSGNDNTSESQNQGDGDNVDEGFLEEEEDKENENENIEEEEEEEQQEEAEEEEEKQEEDLTVKGILYVKGLVSVKRAGSDKWIRARRNMPLNIGDMVKTGENSYAELGCGVGEFSPVTSHGGIISMMQNSTFTVYKNPAVKVERESKIRVMMRDVSDNVKELLGKKSFEIETPSAVAGIRGTDFFVEVDSDGNTTFILDEGKIAVSNLYDDHEVILTKGHKISVSQEGIISDAKAITSEEEDSFNTNYRAKKGSLLLWLILSMIFIIIVLVIAKITNKEK